MVLNNSLVIPDATAEFALEDVGVLRDMCRGHDGKNPNHVIRFVWCDLRKRSVVQYKHFCFDDIWRPTMEYNRETGRWETSTNVTYSWFKDSADLDALAQTVPNQKAVAKTEIDQNVIDNIALCVNSMANFSPQVFDEWTKYFEKIREIMRNPVCDIPILSVCQLVERGRVQPKAIGGTEVVREASKLRLTSVLHASDRETLVCSNRNSAIAWSNNMGDAREQQRVVRLPSSEGVCECLSVTSFFLCACAVCVLRAKPVFLRGDV